jgi:hypothetical protein
MMHESRRVEATNGYVVQGSKPHVSEALILYLPLKDIDKTIT